MATNFNGQLRSNEIFAALYNMIISQQVFADNLTGKDLVDDARVDGSMYGDTKLFYATHNLESKKWLNDAEAANLLDIARPETPDMQAIFLDQFRIISVTVDNYLSKRAWSDEGSFSAFNSVMLGWLSDTKKVYEATTYNCFIGTTETTKGAQLQTVDATNGQKIAEGLANIMTDVTDYTRDYNDYGNLRRFGEESVKIVFNSKYVNKIKNIDLPVLFDNAGIRATFDKQTLPAKYFGAVNAGTKAGDGKTVRSLVEQDIGSNHYFPGELIKSGDTAPAGTSYTQDDKVICKIIGKLPPFMSAFSVQTSFFNPRSLTENHYLIFGHNTLDYFKNYAYITVKAAA